MRHLDIKILRHHDASMRTTLTIDDDIADQLREQARLRDLPFKKVVNDALRRGLGPALPEDRPPFRVKTFRGGYAPGFDPLKIKEFLHEQDIQHYLDVTARLETELEQQNREREARELDSE